MTHYANDTICALATPVGGAIAVVRVSGSQSYPVLGRLLRQDLSACAPATLRHASLYSPEGEEIDDVVVAFYRAPHSYTGEDAIEISCHGSAYIVHQILDALTKAGCRQAEPGEYTRRAYLNGKMDLSQAEAVADLISSSNQASHRLALSQLKGHVRTALETLRERLLRLTSLLELELDFSDHDDLVFADRSKAWTLALKPALVYDMNAMGSEAVRFHSGRAVWEISVGLKYHFGCSNGKHHFTKVRAYDQQEVDVLNAKINELHTQAGKDAKALQEAVRKVTELEAALDKCRNQEPKIVKDTIDNTKKTLESVITFRQGRTTVDNSQLPNVERIATYLKNHKGASVLIKGYASPEGSVEVNERIARQRAEAVKKMLVGKYGIAEERIVAEGQGVGNMFEEPDWNRVSICTINAGTESSSR